MSLRRALLCVAPIVCCLALVAGCAPAVDSPSSSGAGAQAAPGTTTGPAPSVTTSQEAL